MASSLRAATPRAGVIDSTFDVESQRPRRCFASAVGPRSPRIIVGQINSNEC